MMALILQSLLWLLIAFILGLMLGRFLKKLFCPEPETVYQSVTGSENVAVSPAGGAAPVFTATLATAAAGEERADVSRSDAPASEDDVEIASKIPGLKSDNLQIIEGVGPAMEAVLHENGVVSWSQLSRKSETELRGILDSYGDKYRLIDPAPWIPQAKFAAAGQVDELIALQQRDGVSKFRNMLAAAKSSGFGSYTKNDLKLVEGIGPKIEELLKDAEIDSWEKLSTTDISVLRAILAAGGKNFSLADPESWPVQAELALKSDWQKLKEYQDTLQGGRSH